MRLEKEGKPSYLDVCRRAAAIVRVEPHLTKAGARQFSD